MQVVYFDLVQKKSPYAKKRKRITLRKYINLILGLLN